MSSMASNFSTSVTHASFESKHPGMIDALAYHMEVAFHGMNGIAEAVRQVRGTAVNQVASVENVAVTAASGFPTSGLILSAG